MARTSTRTPTLPLLVVDIDRFNPVAQARPTCSTCCERIAAFDGAARVAAFAAYNRRLMAR